MSKLIHKIKTTVEGVQIRGKSLPSGSVVSVVQPGELLAADQINQGVAKFLILNQRAEIVNPAEKPAAKPITKPELN